jgi:predicted DNA-binding transcriptional regulator AlpA
MQKLLTESEAAERLGWSKRTLQRRRWQRLPPSYIKLGRSVRYDPAVIDAFITDGVQEPDPWQQVGHAAQPVVDCVLRGQR